MFGSLNPAGFSEDPFDAADFEAFKYINAAFPDESSLENGHILICYLLRKRIISWNNREAWDVC